ncbi:MAG: beta-glucosidase [Rhodopirellula sp.]|nr:beta-glucosidase [Rhodopirellula sp.]
MNGIRRRTFLQGSLALAAGAVSRSVRAGDSAFMEVIGKVRPRASAAIAASPLGVGFECLDRQMFDPEPCYPFMAQLGAKWARVQTGWARCERAQGQYDFAWLDAIVDRLRSIGIQPWFNLGYGNRLYTPEADNDFAVGWVPLWSDEAHAAWLRFVRALAEHFRGRVKHWEIWNEPNHKNFWKPRPANPAEYVEFVAMTAPVIRQAVPGALILGPTVWGMEYFAECFDRGLGKLIDKVSYHWYRPSPEDRYEASMAAVRDVLARHQLDLPLWQGESGCPSQVGGVGGLSQYNWTEALQARWVARRTLFDLRLRIEMTSYFQMVDMLYPNADGTPGGQDRLNPKGLLRRSDYTPKPAYFVYQCLCALFDAETQWADRPLEVSSADGQPLDPSALLKVAFVRRDRPLYVYWLPADLRKELHLRTADLAIPEAAGAAMDVPVMIDPLTACVHRLPQSVRSRERWRIPGVPLSDCPLIVADRSVAELA